MNKHLKTCLGQKSKAKSFQATGGDDVDMSRHLGDMSARRPDIFGATTDKIQLQENKGEEKVYFDGQAANINRSTGSMTMLMHQQKKIKEDLEK